MKHFVIIVLIIFSTPIFSYEKIFKEIDSLIEINKYKTAYELLISKSKEIPENELLKKKTELSINYFVHSMSHEMFSFIDIPEGHDIYDYRGKDGSYSSNIFRVGEEYEKMINLYPTDGELNFWLAEYYYDVLLRYQGRWIKNDDEIIELAILNYNAAITKNYSNDILDGNLGYMYLKKGLFDKSEYYYKKSINLNPKNPSLAYQLSLALIRQGKYNEVLNYIDIAIKQYKDNNYIADSLHIAGDAELNLNNLKKSIEHFENAKVLKPQYYIYYQRLILLYLATENLDKADINSQLLFEMYPTNPSATQYIIQEYSSYNKLDNALLLFKNLISKYNNNNEALGNLYFHKYIIDENLKNYDEAHKDLENAKLYFSKVFDNSHNVFSEIERLKNTLK